MNAEKTSQLFFWFIRLIRKIRVGFFVGAPNDERREIALGKSIPSRLRRLG
jgi:hypothetical protein